MEIINNPEEKDGKTVAIISYITFIGWIISYVLHSNTKTSLGIFHIRQSLLLHVTWLAAELLQRVAAFMPVLGELFIKAIHVAEIGLLVFWIVGIIYAARGEEKPLPFIGQYARQFFSGIK